MMYDSKAKPYPLQVHHMYRDRLLKKAPKTVGVWSAWGPWTTCSRSCGGGVTQQTRHCINRPADTRFVRGQRRRRQANGCVGLYKRIHLCNSQNCPSGRDFRYEQCAAFNHRLFKGKTYVWEPFLNAPDECALNCRASGLNFYATLNKTVIDGTSCSRPLTSYGRPAPRGTRGVCIEGSCKAWLEEAEAQAKNKRRDPDAPSVLPAGEKKRKRTSIAAPEKRSLEAYFAVQPRPSGRRELCASGGNSQHPKIVSIALFYRNIKAKFRLG
ncbi:Papilin-like Protein [Tribolium castaneum]|uniref:Papilin-like Protein n=1 Tax=Tribolium castaneum TaxID=7070 RepID=A0A139WEE8_TRICA|nr:Papilin-like Protein [Tribolium castaneum]